MSFIPFEVSIAMIQCHPQTKTTVQSMSRFDVMENGKSLLNQWLLNFCVSSNWGIG